MKNVISIFCLPYEIDDLELTITQLRKSVIHLEEPDDWYLHVTMCLANDMTNWNDSVMHVGYFRDKFLKLERQCGFKNKSFEFSGKIKGCVSQRRYTLEKYNDADYFIWLDTDIIFSSDTLAYFEMAIINTKEKYPYSIITPEIVRIWDETWDCLVNEKFKDKPLNYQKTNDPYEDSGVSGSVSVESVSNAVFNQPRYKFAGGWFTCISGELLRRLGVPKSLGHYGLEDTFIMHGSEKLLKLGVVTTYQFKLKGLVICENYKYRDNTHITNHLKVIDRREEFKKIAHSNFMHELNSIS